MSKRRAVFSSRFLDDLGFWVRTDRKVALRILKLVEHTLRDPFSGPGKPEPLRRELSGLGSRRMTQEHRLVYGVIDGEVRFLQGRYHY